MATRTLNRRALRDRNAAAEPDEPERDGDEPEDGADEDDPKPRARKKASGARAKAPAGAKAPAKPRARKKDKVPQRMVARWAVCDNGAKRLAVFEYKDRAGADAKLAEVRERKPGTYFLVLVKDPYDPPTVLAGPV
jgi:hypothetical protein